MGKDNKSRKCNGLLKLYSLKILTYIDTYIANKCDPKK